MPQIVLSIDTEFWRCSEQWPDRGLAHPIAGLDEAYRRFVLGSTPSGDYGLPFLLHTLRQHKLQGVFFVESLSSSAIGSAWLRRTVRDIVDAGQEVQLHLHTEWLSDVGTPGLSLSPRQKLGDHTLDEQTAIVRHGLAKLAMPVPIKSSRCAPATWEAISTRRPPHAPRDCRWT